VQVFAVPDAFEAFSLWRYAFLEFPNTLSAQTAQNRTSRDRIATLWNGLNALIEGQNVAHSRSMIPIVRSQPESIWRDSKPIMIVCCPMRANPVN
jgi:hypothetical protein